MQSSPFLCILKSMTHNMMYMKQRSSTTAISRRWLILCLLAIVVIATWAQQLNGANVVNGGSGGGDGGDGVKLEPIDKKKRKLSRPNNNYKNNKKKNSKKKKKKVLHHHPSRRHAKTENTLKPIDKLLGLLRHWQTKMQRRAGNEKNRQEKKKKKKVQQLDVEESLRKVQHRDKKEKEDLNQPAERQQLENNDASIIHSEGYYYHHERHHEKEEEEDIKSVKEAHRERDHKEDTSGDSKSSSSSSSANVEPKEEEEEEHGSMIIANDIIEESSKEKEDGILKEATTTTDPTNEKSFVNDNDNDADATTVLVERSSNDGVGKNYCESSSIMHDVTREELSRESEKNVREEEEETMLLFGAGEDDSSRTLPGKVIDVENQSLSSNVPQSVEEEMEEDECSHDDDMTEESVHDEHDESSHDSMEEARSSFDNGDNNGGISTENTTTDDQLGVDNVPQDVEEQKLFEPHFNEEDDVMVDSTTAGNDDKVVEESLDKEDALVEGENQESHDDDIQSSISEEDVVSDRVQVHTKEAAAAAASNVISKATKQQKVKEDDINSNSNSNRVVQLSMGYRLSTSMPTLSPISTIEEEEEVDLEASTSSSSTFSNTLLKKVVTIVTFLATIFPIIYSIAVHTFLSSFHERSFWSVQHWHPVGQRVLAASLIWGVHWGLNWALANYENVVAEVLLVLLALAATISGIKFILHTRRKEVDGPPPPFVCMKNKVVFITGANGGIGLETARQLYHRGATIILGCRSKSRALDAMRDIDPSYDHHHEPSSNPTSIKTTNSPKKQQPQGALPRRLHFVELDLTSNTSIRKAVETFLEMNVPLHVLINNAGVMRSKRDETVDGLEMTMAANHLGHFLLTNLLLPKLRETAFAVGSPSRVITVSSSLYKNARRRVGTTVEPGIDLQDLQCCNKKYALFEQYSQSKLANILFSTELGRRERCRMKEPRLEQQKLPEPSISQEEQKQQRSERVSNQPTVIPPKKVKKKLRPKLTPVEKIPSSDAVGDDVGLGFDDIVTSEHSCSQSTPPRKKKERKSLRPKITPVEKISSSDEEVEDELGLGFNDIVPSDQKQSTTPPRMKKERKSLRAKLTPVENLPSEDEDDNKEGLGFEDIVLSTRSSIAKKLAPAPLLVEKLSSSEETENGAGTRSIDMKGKKKKKKKLRPKLAPTFDAHNDDEGGLGFEDVAPSLSSESKKNFSKKGNRRSRKLTPLSPSSEEDDEIGLGFYDIVVSATPTAIELDFSRQPQMSASSSTNEEKKEDSDEQNLEFGDTAVSSSSFEMEKETHQKIMPLSGVVNCVGESSKSNIINALSPPPEALPTATPSVEKSGRNDNSSSGYEVISTVPSSEFSKSDSDGTSVSSIAPTKQTADLNPTTELSSSSKEDCKPNTPLFCPIQSCCLHPGLVRTNVVRDMPWYLYYPNKIFSIFMAMLQKTPQAGAYTSVFCTLMDESGMQNYLSYYVNSKLQPLDELALSEKDSRKLWEMSCELVSINTK